MANARKPAAARQRVNKPKKPDERSLVPLRVPDPPDGLTPGVLEWWEGFWGLEVVQATVAPSDMPAARRLAGVYAKLERIEAELLNVDWVVAGSTGQDRLHPLFGLWDKLLRQAEGLEDRFGLNPKARLGLGLQLGQVRRSLDDLNRRLRSPDEAVVDVDVADPRVAG